MMQHFSLDLTAWCCMGFGKDANRGTNAMTLAHDAYRYVTREYKNPFAHVRKMDRKHGTYEWVRAWMIAMTVCKAHSDQCAYVVIGKIEDALK